MIVAAPPAPRPHWVARPRLLHRLLELPTTAVVLATAPAGWGKSTLFTQWQHHRHESRPFAWVRLEPDDDLGTVATTVDELVASLMTGPTATGVLVVEDLSPGRSVVQQRHLARAVDGLPVGVTLAVSARTAGACAAIGRARAPIVRLGPDELAFTTSETHAVVRLVTSQEVSGDEVALLHAWTDGWPAAVCVAAAAHGTASDGLPGSEPALAGTSEVRDYVESEVVALLDDDVRDFLVDTSILERLTPPLCEAVAGRPDAAELLGRAADAGLVVPDRVSDGHRYRGPVLAALRSRLGGRHAEVPPVLHRRAARWHARGGSVDAAIHHAGASGDGRLLARLVADHWPDEALRGADAHARTWLQTCGDQDVIGDPPLALAGMWLGGIVGDAAVVQRLLPVASHGPADAPVGGFGALRSALALVRLFMTDEPVSTVWPDVEQAALVEGRRETVWRATADLAVGWVRYLCGHPDAARPLDRAIAGADGQPLVRSMALAAASVVAVEDARLDDALSLATRALDVVDDAGLADHPQSWGAHVAHGAVLARTGRPEDAATALERGITQTRALATVATWPLMVALDHRDRAAAPGGGLSPRELHVLRLLRGPLAQADLARELGVTTNTVKSHVRAVYRKLGASSREDAVSRARHHGLL